MISNSNKGLPTTLFEAVNAATNVVVLVLMNEIQCQDICFDPTEENLLDLLPGGCLVILSSTVTAAWVKEAHLLFNKKGIHVDCPTSGGPVRTRSGDLTLMASGDDKSLEIARPLLECMGSDIHIIQGGAGMGSTVKMVHQLLAGVHVCAAAEARALAAAAGIDVSQLHEIVNGAAGASWMFRDRGQRMIQSTDNVKSSLDFFVKDLGIVFEEAKRLQAPIPLASMALQQFIIGQALGLSRKDDSQVV